MQPHPKLRILLILTWLLAPLLALASACGLLVPATYARETAYFAVQGLGQDAFDLLIAVPALLLSLLGLQRGWRPAWHVYGGLILYLIYTFVIYAFSLTFNYLFLVYCAILGLSVYAGLIFFTGLRSEAFQDAYGRGARVKALAYFLLVIAVMFGAIWLKEDIPAILSGRLPASVVEQGLRTNAVHILDLSLALPAMVIAAAALLRGKALGVVLGPALALFSTAMALSIAALALAMKIKGQTADLGLTVLFCVIALVSLGVFVAFEKSSLVQERHKAGA